MDCLFFCSDISYLLVHDIESDELADVRRLCQINSDIAILSLAFSCSSRSVCLSGFLPTTTAEEWSWSPLGCSSADAKDHKGRGEGGGEGKKGIETDSQAKKRAAWHVYILLTLLYYF